MNSELFSPAMLEVYNRRCVKAFLSLSSDTREAGMRWYDSYHLTLNHLALAFDRSLFQVCEAAAWLSLGCDWDKQAMPQLIKMLHAGSDADSVKCSTYGPNKVKAIKCLNDGTSHIHRGSPKADRFARLLFDPKNYNGVACDRHHIAAITGKRIGGKPSLINPRPEAGITPHQYELLERATQEAAHTLSILPHQLQAGIWIQQKVSPFVW